MRVTIRNLSKKPRSNTLKNDLKFFAAQIAEKFGIAEHIKEIRLEYRDNFNGYYKDKSKPLDGFKMSYDKGYVTIQFADYYDKNQMQRRSFIVHELTHARQLISGDLKIINGRKAIWKGKENHTWKNFRWKTLNALPQRTGAVNKYLRDIFPWEVEVQKNCQYYR